VIITLILVGLFLYIKILVIMIIIIRLRWRGTARTASGSQAARVLELAALQWMISFKH